MMWIPGYTAADQEQRVVAPAAAARMGVCLTADSEDAHTSCRICFEEAPVEDLISPCKCKVRLRGAWVGKLVPFIPRK
jgi:hypothetical protein